MTKGFFYGFNFFGGEEEEEKNNNNSQPEEALKLNEKEEELFGQMVVTLHDSALNNSEKLKRIRILGNSSNSETLKIFAGLAELPLVSLLSKDQEQESIFNLVTQTSNILEGGPDQYENLMAKLSKEFTNRIAEEVKKHKEEQHKNLMAELKEKFVKEEVEEEQKKQEQPGQQEVVPNSNQPQQDPSEVAKKEAEELAAKEAEEEAKNQAEAAAAKKKAEEDEKKRKEEEEKERKKKAEEDEKEEKQKKNDFNRNVGHGLGATATAITLALFPPAIPITLLAWYLGEKLVIEKIWPAEDKKGADQKKHDAEAEEMSKKTSEIDAQVNKHMKNAEKTLQTPEPTPQPNPTPPSPTPPNPLTPTPPELSNQSPIPPLDPKAMEEIAQVRQKLEEHGVTGTGSEQSPNSSSVIPPITPKMENNQQQNDQQRG